MRMQDNCETSHLFGSCQMCPKRRTEHAAHLLVMMVTSLPNNIWVAWKISDTENIIQDCASDVI